MELSFFVFPILKLILSTTLLYREKYLLSNQCFFDILCIGSFHLFPHFHFIFDSSFDFIKRFWNNKVRSRFQFLFDLGYILEAANCSFDNVVKTTVLLADINDFGAVNEVYTKFFTSNYPARAAYQVTQWSKLCLHHTHHKIPWIWDHKTSSKA